MTAPALQFRAGIPLKEAMAMNHHDFGRLACALMALTLTACADDGIDGADGAPGTNGTNGSNGAPGTNGTNGMDGLASLIAQTAVAPGADCRFGGVRVDSGVDDSGDGTLDAGEVDDTQFLCHAQAAFTMQLLHFADVDGNEATALENVDDFSALVDGFRNDPTYGGHTLVVSSGDNVIPGPRWFAAENGDIRNLTGSNEPGHVDHLWLNEFGVAASALGNHELDQGPGEFSDALASESRNGVTFPGSQFPYLAANVDFSGDDDLAGRTGTDGDLSPLMAGQVAASTVALVGGELVGIVGASTPNLSNITTTGDLTVSGSTTAISELAAAVQPSIDALTARGINKIVVLAHMQQIAVERALAAELTDVDVIVAGGSNTRMGDATDALYPGDSAFDEGYPFEATDAENNPTLIVNVDGDYKYLGRLVVGFDENGIVIPGSVDENVSGAWASTPENILLSGGEAIEAVVETRDAVQTVIFSQFENVVGHTSVFLEGRRGVVRTEETNLGNLTADSMKWYAENCTGITNAIGLKNGGGIRAEIGNAVVTGDTTELFPPFNDGLAVDEGDISEGHLRGTLRFDNGLVLIDVTPEELKMLLEHGVASTEPGATPGRFPQVAGVSFGFDPSGVAQELAVDGSGDITGIATAGTRVTDIVVDTDGDGMFDTALYVGGVLQTGLPATLTVVTLNFLANGGDDYPYALVASPNRRQLYAAVGFGDPDGDDNGIPDFPVLTGCDPGAQSTFSDTGGEQDALAEYLLDRHPDMANAFDIAETAPADDRRIQNLSIISAFVEP